MSKEDRNRADARFNKAAHAAHEAKNGKTERDAALKAVTDNMAKLKALRLAREAAEPQRPAAAAKKARADYMDALANDLNTADARAPIFELVRAANTAIDKGELRSGDRDAIQLVLKDFDAVFDVLVDTDAEATKRALAWAEQAGRMNEVAPDLLARQGLSDETIDALVAERTQAKQQRNFARADQIRNELAEKGVVLEDSKDGVRWKRK